MSLFGLSDVMVDIGFLSRSSIISELFDACCCISCVAFSRLETRTKESNILASFESAMRKLSGVNEGNFGYLCPSWEIDNLLLMSCINLTSSLSYNAQRQSGAIHSGFSTTVDLSWASRYVRTRKMVIYAWIGWSQRKLWWKPKALLTCKSLVKSGYRGERLIEPSSSWFHPKFPSGKHIVLIAVLSVEAND